LRTRGPADVERLARHFAAQAARRHGRSVPALSASALDRLRAYHWPGNVRELEHCIESAVVIMEGESIEAEDLPLVERVPSSRAPRPVLGRSRPPARRATPIPSLEEVERDHILSVLRHAGGNRTRAAELLGIGRNTLGRKLKKFGA
jgi:Nif-specific regulatory protein